MVVVVRGGSSLWTILAAIILVVIIILSIILFLITKGTVLIVAIPGFPVESIILGLAAGTLLIALRRRPSRKSTRNN